MTKEAKPLRRSGKKQPEQQAQFTPEDLAKAIAEFVPRETSKEKKK